MSTDLVKIDTWIEFDRVFVGESISVGMRINTGFVILGNAPDGTRIKSTYDPATKEVIWEYLL